jgi:tRNA threonylcarbamoyladenosine biosynthesis protein TsaE
VLIKKLSLIVESQQETLNIGRHLGELLEAGDVVALIGELGSGKTCLTKGIAYGMGISDHQYVTSPSFTIINEYQGKFALYHIDLYRMEKGFDEELLGLKEYIYSPAVTVIEWAERLSELPEERIEIHMDILGDERRRLYIIAHGNHPVYIIEKVQKEMDAGI